MVPAGGDSLIGGILGHALDRPLDKAAMEILLSGGAAVAPERLDEEVAAMAARDAAEGFDTFLDKRPPVWEGR